MAVEKYVYSWRPALYSADRKERQGYLVSYVRSGSQAGRKIDFTGSYYQVYTVDMTDTENWTTLFELSNGVKYQFKARSPLTVTGDTEVIYYDSRILGSDGTTTIYEFYSTTQIDTAVNNNAQAVQITGVFGRSYYFGEQSLAGAHPDPMDLDWHLLFKKTNETGIYPVPNQQYDMDFWSQNWTSCTVGMGSIYSDDELLDKLRELDEIGDGTPIAPIKYDEDESKPDGGDGDYDPFSDPIDFPDLPTGGDSISTGFVRVYTPSTSQLNNLASVLWSDSFVNTIKKIQNDPMEAIISLHSIPVGLIGTSTECRVGNFNTGVSMPAVSTQFHTINLGSIDIPEHWGTALDYSPYCTVDIFLPFVGVASMQIDDVVGKTLTVKYNVDILSGATLASIMCGESVLYTYNTNMIMRHPISQSSYGPLYQSIIGMVGSVASGFASGGTGGAIGGAIGGALNVAMSKQHAVNRGGSIGGATGVLGHFVPYLIIHRPIQSLAAGFAHFKGFPSNITARLGNMSGYTEVESIHLENISCTDRERDEIMALLYNGVIL